MRAFVIALVLGLAAAWTLPAWAADEKKVKSGARQVESGAKKIGKGKVGAGAADMAKGAGNTVVESAKFTGEKFKDAGAAAEAPSKSAWQNLKDGNIKESAIGVGRSVKGFFTRLFTN